MNRHDILETTKAILGDRGATHGSADELFDRIAMYWSGHLGQEVSPHDVAIMMVLFKMARVAANPAHEDSLVDACGYLALASELQDVV